MYFIIFSFRSTESRREDERKEKIPLLKNSETVLIISWIDRSFFSVGIMFRVSMSAILVLMGI